MLLLRCYPTIPDFINHVFGTELPSFPPNTFGFFVALAFVSAASLLVVELKRKEKLGIFEGIDKKITKGLPPKALDLLGNAFIGFIIGYKLIGAVLDWESCSADAQSYLISSDGNWLAGIVVAGIFAYLKYREVKKEQLPKPVVETVRVMPHEMIGEIVLWAAIGGFAGANIFSFFESPDAFKNFLQDPIGSLFSGLTIYGGLVGGTISVVYFAVKNKIKLIPLADSVTPTLFMAYAVGRMGCQVSGDGDWGIVNTNPKPDLLSWLPDWMWAYNYPHNVNNDGIPIPGCEETYCYMLEHAVYPTPIYEIIMALILFGILWSLRKRIKYPGVLTSMYLLFNGFERFWIEKIRVNYRFEMLGFQITQAEIIAIVFMLVGIAGIIYFRRSGLKTYPWE